MLLMLTIEGINISLKVYTVMSYMQKALLETVYFRVKFCC